MSSVPSVVRQTVLRMCDKTDARIRELRALVTAAPIDDDDFDIREAVGIAMIPLREAALALAADGACEA